MQNQVLDWLKAAFAVARIKKYEATFDCPYCGHSAFYFNYKKRVGYCHRASCGRKPTLKDIIDLKGYGPSDYYNSAFSEDAQAVVTPAALELPGIDLLEDRGRGRDEWAIQALGYRGVTLEHISKWKIKATNLRIYVPIIQEYKLVQYLGRVVDRSKNPKDGFNSLVQPKYKYAEGASISNFIFGWDHTTRKWPYVVLVENTFNAIAWRDKFNCTTNFGSNLSKVQIELLYKSEIRRVVFAWDGDAYQKAYDASFKLKEYGIQSSILSYSQSNQPDQVKPALLKTAIETAINGPQTYGPLQVRINENELPNR